MESNLLAQNTMNIIFNMPCSSSFSLRYFLSVVRVLFDLMPKFHQLLEIDCETEQLYVRGQSIFPLELQIQLLTPVLNKQNVTSLGPVDTSVKEYFMKF